MHEDGRKYLARVPGREDAVDAVRLLHPGHVQGTPMDEHNNDGGVGVHCRCLHSTHYATWMMWAA